MSIKILTMLSISWLNSWHLVLKISVSSVMLINLSMVGVVLIWKISLILRKIILKPRLLCWKKTIVPLRKYCKQLMPLSIITAIVVRKNFGHKMLTGNKLFTTVRVMNVKKQSSLLQRLTILSVNKGKTLKILRFFTVPMRNHVLLKKRCSNQIFLILWLVERNSTAVRKFET